MALIRCDFQSKVLKLATSMTVLLPEVAGEEEGTSATWAGGVGGPYKVLWLLHGLSDDHTIWQRRTSIERYLAGTGVAAVMPAVHRSFYMDMDRGGRYWEFVSEELPGICRSWFPLSAKREDNVVAGLSMGGYGAFLHALSHPDRYAAAASLSGAVDVASLGDRHKENAEEFTNMFGPLDKVGGSDMDLMALADQLVASDGPRPRLFQWCGTEDFLYEDNLHFRDHARKIGLEVDYSEGPGGHTWDKWDAQIQRVIEWAGWRQD